MRHHITFMVLTLPACVADQSIYCEPYLGQLTGTVEDAGILAELQLQFSIYMSRNFLSDSYTEALMAEVTVDSLSFTDGTPSGFDVSVASGRDVGEDCEEGMATFELMVSLNVKGDGEDDYIKNVGLDLAVSPEADADSIIAHSTWDVRIFRSGEEVLIEQRTADVVFHRIE